MSDYATTIQTLFESLASNLKGSVHYVTAGPYGKSTMLVPHVWKYAKSVRPQAQGLYVQGTDLEVVELDSYCANTEDEDHRTETQANIVPRGDRSKLGLLSYPRFHSTLANDETFAWLEFGNMVLFLDVERSPTVKGEMTIGFMLAKLSRYLDENGLSGGDVNLSIILLGSRYRQEITDAFAAYVHVDVTHLEWHETLSVSPLCLNPVQDPVEDVIVSHLFGSSLSEEEPASCVVIFQSYDAFSVSYLPGIETCEEMDGIQLKVHVLKEDSSSDDLGDILDETEPFVLCVEPGFLVSLPIPNVKAILGGFHRTVKRFDRNTSQFALVEVLPSEAELHQERAWAIKSLTYLESPPPYLTFLPKANYDLNPREDYARLEADVMRLCLHASIAFQDLWPERSPVPGLRLMHPDIIREAKFRLGMMGCLVYGSHAPVATDLGIKTLEYMENTEFNCLGSIQLANLLARIDTNTDLPLPVRRVLVRIAALTDFNPFFVTDEAFEALETHGEEILKAIENGSAGLGQREARTGHIWMQLGLWTKYTTESEVEKVIDMPMADGIVMRSGRGIAKVEAYVRGLEQRLGLPPVTNELADTMLEPSHQLLAFETFARAYLHQLVFFSTQDPPTDVVSMRRVRITRYSHIVNFEELVRRSTVKFPGICAVYTSARVKEGQFEVEELTLIPNLIFNRILASFNVQHLTALLASGYPFPIEN
ncbi:hypothetical protein F4819DRAFT_504751 [Hypoxylon fuscum]|nr:hypothetical protein F4819DRAFT_504751 [Hypoxylon fuscum]